MNDENMNIVPNTPADEEPIEIVLGEVEPQVEAPEEEDCVEEAQDAPQEVEEDCAEEPQDASQGTEEEEAPQSKKAALLGAIFSDSDEPDAQFNLNEMVRNFKIDGMWFYKQLGVILLIVFFVVVYITNRYQAQEETIEQAHLKEELADWKYRAITRSSELTNMSKQSEIEQALRQLGDSTLKTSNISPFVIIKQE